MSHDVAGGILLGGTRVGGSRRLCHMEGHPVTAPLTPEEREAMLAFLRESLAQAPDASPLHSLRFLLAELDRVTAERDEYQALRDGNLETAEDEARSRYAAQASARAWQEKAVELEEGLARQLEYRGPIHAVMDERDTALAEAERQKTHNELQTASLRQQGERIKQMQLACEAAQGEAKRLRGALETLRTMFAETRTMHGPEVIEAALAPHPAPEPTGAEACGRCEHPLREHPPDSPCCAACSGWEPKP